MGGAHGYPARTEGAPNRVDNPGLNLKLTCFGALQVSFISPQEAVFAQERGVPIVDVRPAVDHYCSRIPGSVGVPFMRSITGMLTSTFVVSTMLWYTQHA